MLWRLLKFVALALFSAGLAGQLQAANAEARLRWLNRAILPGYLVLNAAGWMMAKHLGVSMGAPWISATLLLSLLALWGTLRSAVRAPGFLSAALSLAGLLGSLGLMVLRPTQGAVIGGTVALSALLGAGLAAWAPRRGEAATREQVSRAFRVVAYAEGSSLLLMMAINMPLKRLAGVSIDGDTGLIGWIHGVLVLVYLFSLGVTARAQGWGVGRVVVAFVASLVPGVPLCSSAGWPRERRRGLEHRSALRASPRAPDSAPRRPQSPHPAPPPRPP